MQRRHNGKRTQNIKEIITSTTQCTQHPNQKRSQQQKSTAPLRDNAAANDDTTTPHAGQWIKWI